MAEATVPRTGPRDLTEVLPVLPTKTAQPNCLLRFVIHVQLVELESTYPALQARAIPDSAGCTGRDLHPQDLIYTACV